MKARRREQNGFGPGPRRVGGKAGVLLVRGVRTFPELVRSLPGVYPADALRAVGRLRQELPAGWQMSGTSSVAPALDGWPVEHPLDFDWRFTPEAVRLLIDRCHRNAPDSVAFLGAPSLAREAAVRGLRAGVSLFDKNPALVAAIRASLPGVTAACIDLVWGDPVGVGTAAVAVADPPWYSEHTLAFLWAASRLTRIGGRVLLSLPPEGTRPGGAERDAVFRAPGRGILRASAGVPGRAAACLAYRTPPFERNALAAAGVPEVPWDWRRGDLAEFVVVAEDGRIAPRCLDGPLDVWDEESVGVVRIQCRTYPDNGFRDPTLSPAVPGDILATVSRASTRPRGGGRVDLRQPGFSVCRCGGVPRDRLGPRAGGRRGRCRGRDDREEAVRRRSDFGTPGRQGRQPTSSAVARKGNPTRGCLHRRHERDLAKAV